MSLTKIWTIAWKDLYITYTDRNLLLIMLATPLALATIISLAFSNFFVGSAPALRIPIAVVNQDAGVTFGADTINHGDLFVQLLVPPAGITDEERAANGLFTLTEAVALTDAEAARAGVTDGTYRAAIIIPPDFSANLTYTQERQSIEPSTIELYASSATPTSGNIVRGVVESIASQLAVGNVAVAATLDTLIARAQTDPAFGLPFGLASAAGGFQPDFAAAFDPASNPIRIEQQTIAGEQTSFNPIVMFGSGQAVFFMLFTAMGSANSILEERRDWTLQRLIASPTSRLEILLGKSLGTFVNCALQVAILLIVLTFISSLITGQFQLIWGSNLLGVAAMTVMVALAASGLATVVAALARTPEQGNIAGGVISMAMGLFGGVFFNVQGIPALQPLSQLTLVFWGVNGYTKLSQNQNDIGLNLVVLLVLGVVMFVIGLAIFNRRLDI